MLYWFLLVWSFSRINKKWIKLTGYLTHWFYFICNKNDRKWNCCRLFWCLVLGKQNHKSTTEFIRKDLIFPMCICRLSSLLFAYINNIAYLNDMLWFIFVILKSQTIFVKTSLKTFKRTCAEYKNFKLGVSNWRSTDRMSHAQGTSTPDPQREKCHNMACDDNMLPQVWHQCFKLNKLFCY